MNGNSFEEMSVGAGLAEKLVGRPDKFAMCRSEIEALGLGFDPESNCTAFGPRLNEAGYTYTHVRDQDNSKVWLITRGSIAKSYHDLVCDLEREKIEKIKTGLAKLEPGDVRRITEHLKCEIRQHACDLPPPTHYLISWGRPTEEHDMEPFRRVGWKVTPKITQDHDGEEFIRGYYFSK